MATRWGHAAARVREWLRPRALVLMYHRIATPERDPWQLCVTPAHFAEHLEVIRRHGSPVPLRTLRAHLARGRVPFRTVVVTLDDGYADNLHQAQPLLERHDVPATVFVAAAYLDGPGFWWDELERRVLAPLELPAQLQLRLRDQVHRFTLGAGARQASDPRSLEARWRASADPPTERCRLFLDLYRLLRPLTDSERRQALSDLGRWSGVDGLAEAPARPLTVHEVQALGAGGLIEIGAHTLTHPQLSALPTADQRTEIRGSREALAEIMGGPITSFAYPYGGRGDYTSDTVALVRDAGFSAACAAESGTVRRGTAPLEIPRLHVDDCDGDGLARRLAGWTSGGL